MRNFINHTLRGLGAIFIILVGLVFLIDALPDKRPQRSVNQTIQFAPAKTDKAVTAASSHTTKPDQIAKNPVADLAEKSVKTSAAPVAIKASALPARDANKGIEGASKPKPAIVQAVASAPKIIPAAAPSKRQNLPKGYRVTATILNQRTAPGSGKVVDRATLDQKLTVYKIVDGWALISPPADAERWVSVKFLAPVKPAIAKDAKSVLSVPQTAKAPARPIPIGSWAVEKLVE